MYSQDNKKNNNDNNDKIIYNNNGARDELRRWNPMEEEWSSGRNNYDVDVDNAAVAIDGFEAEQRPVCKYFEVRNHYRQRASAL